MEYYCYDRAGNRSTTNYINVWIDKISPIIQVSNIKNGVVYYDIVRPVVKVTESNIAEQLVELNDATYVSGTLVSNEGINRLYVYVKDLSGNITETEVVFIIDRFTPPAKVTGLQSIVNGRDVTLFWDRNNEPDLLGYNIYRSNGAMIKINTDPISIEKFIDENLVWGGYTYWVSAVDRLLNEGELSDLVKIDVQMPAFSIKIQDPTNRTFIGADDNEIDIQFHVNNNKTDFDKIIPEYGYGDAPTEWFDAEGFFDSLLKPKHFYWSITNVSSGIYTFRLRGMTNNTNAAMDTVILYLGDEIDLDALLRL